MKFGKQMSYVAVKAWYDNYINFKQFKKLLSKGKARIEEGKENGLSEAEIENIKNNFIEEFSHKLYKSINATTRFYTLKYAELQQKIDDITVDMHEHNEYSQRSNAAQKAFIKRILALTLTCYELRTFLEINKTAGRKLVKKVKRRFGETDFVNDYDSMQNELFRNMPVIDLLIKELEDQYVRTIREIGETEDKRQRPEIVLDLHDEIDNALKWKQSTVLTNFNALSFRTSELSVKDFKIKFVPIVIALLFILVFGVKQFSSSFSYSSQKALGLVIYALILWSTHAVPLWLTALSTPMWSIVLKLLPFESGSSDSYKEIGKLIEKSVMNPTVFYMMGTFTIAGAFAETELDKKFIDRVIRRTVRRPTLCFITLISLTAFLSMFVSHNPVTFAVLTVLSSFIKVLPNNYADLLVVAAVAGGNIGAFLSPLSSVQNMYASVNVDTYSYLANDVSLSFSTFLGTTLPIAVIYIIVVTIGLYLVMKKRGGYSELERLEFERVTTDFKWRQIYVIVVSVVLVILWIALPYGANHVFSDYGVVGFISLILLYGPGIMTPAHVAKLPWNIIFLLMGGNALSYAMINSGLTDEIAENYASLFNDTNLWVTVLVTCAIVFIVALFARHSVTSFLMMPIIARFASSFFEQKNHLALFCSMAALSISSSMILPYSTYPNQFSVSVVNTKGEQVITERKLYMYSIPASILCFVLTITIGYGINMSLNL